MSTPSIRSLVLATFLGSATTGQALGQSAAGGNSFTPVPHLSGPISVSADSYPFLAVHRIQQVVDLPALGYVEEEFIASGTANVYDWLPDGSLTVKASNAACGIGSTVTGD
jgi:hypothetical protein